MMAIFPKIAESAAQRDYEKLACLVRVHFGKKGPYAPILDLASVYADLDIPICEHPLKGLAAMTCKDAKGTFRLYVLKNSTAFRSTLTEKFTMAHLLGHFFLEIQPQLLRGEWLNTGVLIDQCPEQAYRTGQPRSEQDRSANEFAAALLMPASFVRRASAKMDRIQELAQFFGVTIDTMQTRLAALKSRECEGKRERILKSSSSGPTTPRPQQTGAKGMARIRQIAQDLDKGRPAQPHPDKN